jgi:hypothetical protein
LEPTAALLAFRKKNVAVFKVIVLHMESILEE